MRRCLAGKHLNTGENRKQCPCIILMYIVKNLSHLSYVLSLTGHSFCNLFIIDKDKFHSKAAGNESDAIQYIVQIMSCACIYLQKKNCN